uniref:BTB domain-containing protein n=5 Tax=Ditylum brightwellii TaxID=49249 RepID=A0A7S1Z0K8_9STRA
MADHGQHHDDVHGGAGGAVGASLSSNGLGSVGEQTNMQRFQQDRQALTWSRVTPVAGSALPPPRSGAASVVVKGRLYMFGGYGGGTGRLDDFYSFSFDTCTWEEVNVLSAEKPGCRENNGVVIGDSSRVYLFGGYNGTAWLNDLWMFDIDTQRWTCIQESSDPRPHTNDDSNSALGDHPRPRLGSTVPSRRFGYVSVVHNNKFVLFGGFDGSRWLNDMYEFDFETKTWTEILARGQLPSVRSCPAWAKDETHVYIQGGYDGVERKADFFACDLKTYTWTEMPCRGTPPSPRYFHSCCLYGNKMYAYGGYSGSERLADMYAYDFETNHWSEVDCTNGDCPSGRSSLVAQVYENSLYIFGGYNGVHVLNDFYKFRLKPVSVPPPALVQDLQKLINRPELCDVTFLVEGKEIHANRAILAVRSEYFKVMLFSGGMRESIQMTCGGSDMDSDYSPPIELKDVSHPVFLKVLEYLYTDSICDTSLEVGVPLLIASERFMLDRLKALCEDNIRREISVENVIGIFIASHRHNAIGLKDIALEFILKNLNDPTVMVGLSDLKSEPDLLVEIIKRNTSTQPVSSRDTSHQANGPFGSSSEWSGTRR